MQEEGQIIEALQDMNIEGSNSLVAPQQDAWMEGEEQSDDLLGEELMEMEVKSMDAAKQVKIKGAASNRGTSSKSTSRSKLPHSLPRRKAEFHRRGSPRLRLGSLPPYGEADDQSRKRHSSSKKVRGSSRQGSGFGGSKKPSQLHP